MKTIEPLDQEGAISALVVIAAHTPADVQIGRPVLATVGDGGVVQVATDSGFWWAYPDRAERLVPVRSGLELTVFRDGAEVERAVGC